MPQNYDADKVFTMEQAISICLDPKYSSYSILQTILQVIVAKLNLENSVFALDPGSGKPDDSVIIYYEDPEMFKLGKGGMKKAIRASSLEQLKSLAEYQKKFYKSENHTDAPGDNNHKNLVYEQEFLNTRFQNIEKAIGKISVHIEKLSHQHEDLVERVKRDLEGPSMVMDPVLLFSQPPKMFSEKAVNTEDKFICPGIHTKESNNVQKEHRKHFCELVKKVKEMSNTLEEHKCGIKKIEKMREILCQTAAKDSVEEVDYKVESLCCQLSRIQKDIGKINTHIQDIVECAKYTEKRVKEIQERIKLLDKIREILERLSRFDEWKKKIHFELEKFTEITEHLRIIKADREELDYLFEGKADRDELLKLVSLEFFKSVQDDISTGIVHVLEQLMRDEIEWEKAHKEIELMIDAKADHCEMTSLKKYINCKLEIIQKKLNDIIRNKLTAHAAAVKIRLLKDARCITCTAEADLNDLKYPVPTLGRVRHYEVKCLCEPRNRYCGGSHTVVGVDQKLIVKKKLPLKSAAATTLNFKMTEGTDGRLYRTREPKCICEPLESKEEETVVKKKLFPC